MDFVFEALFNGKRFRALPAVNADQVINGETVTKVMERLTFQRGAAPAKVGVESGPEFICRALDLWAHMSDVTLDFSRPGRPTDNALVETFNGRLRDECLNTHWFFS